MGRRLELSAFKLDRHGPARVLGELEARLMEALWGLGEGSVQEVCDRLGNDPNYYTIITVLNRLVDKGLLKRWKVDRAYHYRPLLSREEFSRQVARQVLRGLLADFGEPAMVQFGETLSELDPETRQRLLDLLGR